MRRSFLLSLAILFTLAAHAQSPYTEYLFADGTLESGTNDNSLTQTGMALTSVADRGGFANNAVSLNGDVLQEQSGAQQTNFSVSFWMKTSTNDPDTRYILDQWGGNPGGKGAIGYQIFLVDGELKAVGKFYVFNQNIHFVSNSINTLGGTIADGQWHHIVLTMSAWSRSTLNGSFPNVSHRLYVDNVLKQTSTQEIPTSGGTGRTLEAIPLSLGNNQSQGAPNNYEDQIDDIRLYTTKLTDAEITTINAQRTAKLKIYVNGSASGTNDGTSWTNAFTNLKTATDYATAYGDEIWVTQGIYKPDVSDRTKFFNLKAGVKLYGGFDGSESQLTERDWFTNRTILSGDLSGDDDADVTYNNPFRNDNSYRIVYVEGSNAEIDGVTITSGQANNTSNNNYNRGGAIYKNPSANNLTLRNTIISKNVSNREGNVHLPFIGTSNELIIEKCIFHSNFARYGGGFSANLTGGGTLGVKVYNSLFHGNQAGNISGADGFTGSSFYIGANAGQIDLTVINSTFTENEDFGTNASNDKGTITIRRLNNNATSIAHATFHNNIFHNNFKSFTVLNEQVIGFMNRPANKLNSLNFTHNISNQTDFSTRATLAVISDNIDQNPAFSDVLSRDFTLDITSPAIDAGSNSQLPNDLFGDFLGNKRINGGIVDMGAYERGSTPRNAVAPNAITTDIAVQLQSNGTVTISASQINNGSTDDDTPANDLIFSLDKAAFTCEDLGTNLVTLTVQDASRNISTATAIVTITSNINDETVSIAENFFCTDANTTVSTGSSVIDINYFLRNSVDNSVVDGPVLGTGSGLVFNTGTITDNTTFNVFGEVPPVTGVSGSLDFDGVNDRVNTTYTFGTTNTFTIEAWIFPRSTTYSRLISNMSSSSLSTNTGDFILDTFGPTDNGRNLRFALDGEASGSNDTQLYAFNVLTLNTWNHIAVTFDNGLTKILVDGVQVASVNNQSFSRILGSTRPVYFGIQNISPARLYDGKMDEVRIWNVAKTAAELSANMNNCLSGMESGLTAYYNFEEGEGTQLTEKVSGKNGTLVNMDAAMAWSDGPELLCSIGCGFQMTNEVTVSVGDNISPIAIAKDATIYFDANGTAALTPEDVNDASTDNCTDNLDLVLSVDKEIFSIANLGSNTVTLTVTDASSNASTANAVVTVLDNLAPIAIAQNITILLDANDNASITSAQIDNGSNDNITVSGDLILSLSKTTFSCADIGQNTITLTVEDQSDNQSTATAIVTVGEEMIPTAIAKNLTVQLDVTGNATIDPTDVDNGSIDNCTIADELTLTLDRTSFNCSQLGAQTVTLTVLDASGNEATAIATVTVEDNIAPVVVTRDITINLLEDGTATIIASDIDDSSSDNCDSPILTLDINSFSTADIGANLVTLTGTDAQGNLATSTATVTVVNRLEQTLSFDPISDKVFGDASFGVTASASSGLDVVFAVISEPATVSGTTVTINGAGTVVIAADQAGNDDFQPATQVTRSFLVAKANQEISITAVDDKLTTDMSFSVIASTTSGLSLVYAVQGPANNVGSEMSLTGAAGIVTVTVSQAGNNNFNTASEQITFNVSDLAKADQTITFSAISDKVFGDANFDLVATASSGLDVTFSILNGSVTISGNTVTILSAGTVEIAANQSGDNDFNAATSVIQSFTVAKADQTITLMAIDNKLTGDPAFDVVAQTTSLLPLVYAVTGPAIIAGKTITLDGTPGTVTVSVSQGGNDNFNSQFTMISFEVTEEAIMLSTEGQVSFQVHPNPAADIITISGLQSTEVTIQIFDIRGKSVLSENLKTSQKLSIDHLRDGLYFMKITDENTTNAAKLLIRR